MSLLMYNKSVGNIIALNITFISFISLYHSKAYAEKKFALRKRNFLEVKLIRMLWFVPGITPVLQIGPFQKS